MVNDQTYIVDVQTENYDDIDCCCFADITQVLCKMLLMIVKPCKQFVLQLDSELLLVLI
jgi:hypothetical protein